RVAEMRDLPKGIDQRSASRHPDWTGPDDLEIKIVELREITDWEKPIFVKIGASRTYYDVALAVKAGADVIVLDGMQGGTAATQEVFIEHVGITILAAIPQAVQSLQELGMHRQVQLIVSGGTRSGAGAGSRTCTASSRRISWHSQLKRRPWPACRWRGRPGFRALPAQQPDARSAHGSTSTRHSARRRTWRAAARNLRSPIRFGSGPK